MTVDVTIGIKKLDENAILPNYKTAEASGADVCSITEYTLGPGERALFKTGIAMEIPLGWEVQVRPRSGLALNEGITVINTPGTIDSDYQNEIGVILINHSTESYHISRGERIAQIVVTPAHRARFKEIKNFEKDTARIGGFGSTGKMEKKD